MSPPRIYPIGDPYYSRAYTTVRDNSVYRPQRGHLRRPVRDNYYPRTTYFPGPVSPCDNLYFRPCDYPSTAGYLQHYPTAPHLGYYPRVPSPSLLDNRQTTTQPSNQQTIRYCGTGAQGNRSTAVSREPALVMSATTNRINPSTPSTAPQLKPPNTKTFRTLIRLARSSRRRWSSPRSRHRT
jgi:hypothetical protein